MKACSFLPFVVGVALCLTGPNPAKEDQAKKDTEQMQSTWKAVSGEQDGKEFPEDGLKQGNMKMTFKGERYTFEMTGNQEEGKVKLHADKKPKAIDFMIESGDDKGKTQLGIYEIEDGKFKLCVAKAGETERPTEFKTKEGSPNVSIVMKKQE
ncbi:MAG TPA: TIGR03067 domain-containing protein [Gemmataceae bacterium]|jgi:uncharacterized protein (TIGR03067 family)|nr:TIGR03067 domain-containing protein [Gemmataceae bacterium]